MSGRRAAALHVGRCPQGACFALAAALALGCATTSLHNRDWLEVRTPNFEILSSLGEKATIELARDLEAFHAGVAYALDLPRSTSETNDTTRVYAFDGRSLTRPFAVRGASSYLLPSLRRRVVVLRTGGGFHDDATRLLRERYARHMLRRHAGQLRPLWYAEGLGQFASTIELRRDGVRIGGSIDDHVRVLRDWSLSSLASTLDANDLEGWTSRDRERFEAESWALVHYLKLGAERQPGQPPALVRYVEALDAGASQVEAARRAFDASDTELAGMLEAYVERSRLPALVVRLGDAFEIPEPSPTPLRRDVALIELAELALAVGKTKHARKYFEMALAANPTAARAHAGLGNVERRAKRWEEALPHYRKALEIAPDDASIQLDVGAYYHTLARHSADPSERTRLLEDARRHYRRSLEADELRADARARLGETFLLEGEDAARGLAWVESARKLRPDSLEIALLYARLQQKLGQREAALETSIAVLNRTHSRDTADAARALRAEILPPPR
jgi:tetratricopeptide (TPR) repeat protein